MFKHHPPRSLHHLKFAWFTTRNWSRFQFTQLWIIHFVHASDYIQLPSPSLNASYKEFLEAYWNRPNLNEIISSVNCSRLMKNINRKSCSSSGTFPFIIENKCDCDWVQVLAGSETFLLNSISTLVRMISMWQFLKFSWPLLLVIDAIEGFLRHCWFFLLDKEK